MRREKQLSGQLFRAVCLGFSALLLVAALFGQIRLVKTREGSSHRGEGVECCRIVKSAVGRDDTI